MALGFARDRLANGRAQHVVVLGLAQHLAQIGVVVLSEAHVKLPSAGQPHAVARFAEIVAERRDEPDALASLLDARITRRATRALIRFRQRPTLGEIAAHIVKRIELVQPVFLAEIAHWHDLDEGEVQPPVAAPLQQFVDLVIVCAAQRHHVDLDPKTCRLRRFDAFQHLIEPAPARDRLKFGLVQRIQRYVDPFDPDICQRLRHFLELRAIGRHGQLVQTVAQMPAHTLEEPEDVFTHQWLTARHTQLAHAHADEGRTQPVHFLQRQQLLFRQERHVLRHAIHTAEITPVRHRYAQIRNRALKRIDQGCLIGHLPSRFPSKIGASRPRGNHIGFNPVSSQVCQKHGSSCIAFASQITSNSN